MADNPVTEIPEQPTPRKRRRNWWPAAAGVTLLTSFLWLGPRLMSGWLLSQINSGDTTVSGQFGGPLWAPTIRGAAAQLPGVHIKAGQAGVRVGKVDWQGRVIYLDISARDAEIDLKLKDLFEGAGGGGGAGGGWQVALRNLDIENSHLNINGQGADIPDGRFTVSRQPSGALAIRGATKDGPLNADLTVRSQGGRNIFQVDINASARVLRYYYPGVDGGQIRGQYVIGDPADPQQLRGDLTLTGGVLTVPEADFVRIREIGGTVRHRGPQIDVALQGRVWDGPITARFQSNVDAQQWTFQAQGSPSVASFGRSLGFKATGGAKLDIQASGWQKSEVRAQLRGSGQIEGVPFRGLRADYHLINAPGKTPMVNVVDASTQTELAGQQRLKLRWNLDRQGVGTWQGRLAEQPLNLRLSIDREQLLRWSGQGLGGKTAGRFSLKSQTLTAQINPHYGAVHATLDLRGKPDNLQAKVSGGAAGPFALAGDLHWNKSGLQADLGGLALRLDRQLRGRWVMRDWQGAGVRLSGAGTVDLPKTALRGTLAAQVPGVKSVLSGPVNVNATEQRGEWLAGNQQLGWQGKTFSATLRGLALASGPTVTGQVGISDQQEVSGQVRVTGNGLNLVATGEGKRVGLRGQVRGVTVRGATWPGQGFRTTAQVTGSDLQAEVTPNGDGVDFVVLTPGQRASGRIAGQRWTAQGGVNAAALRQLMGIPDLAGQLDLHLTGQGGTVGLNLSAGGGDLRGTLRRRGEDIFAQVQGRLNDLSADLSGQVFPQVSSSGVVRWQQQAVQARLFGPYDQLRAEIRGRTQVQTLEGVTVPAQMLRLSGTVTPRPRFSGTWGQLEVGYDAGVVAVEGTQALQAFGQTATISGSASWSEGFRGQVNLRGVTRDITVRAQGPWQNLLVSARHRQGFQATGRASLPAGRYHLSVRGQLPEGLYATGQVRGVGAAPRGEFVVKDPSGGQASVVMRSLQDFDIRSHALKVGAQAVDGQLQVRQGLLDGQLTLGPLLLSAKRGTVWATGNVADHSLSAQGRLVFPNTLKDLTLEVSGPYVRGAASGDMEQLRGQLTLLPQRWAQGPTRLSVPQQTLPLKLFPTAGRVQLAGLSYSNGLWQGTTPLRYDLAGETGQVALTGQGKTLLAQPSGPLRGEIALPELRGHLSASAALLTPYLPAEVARQWQPGRIQADVNGQTALLNLGGRYQGQALGLIAQVGWQGGLSVRGQLTHPGTRIPLNYDGKNLEISQARVDAALLRPWLPADLRDLRGTLRVNLRVPQLDARQAVGRADVRLERPGQRANGYLLWRAGQLSANLGSDLAGQRVTVRGPLYPQANATWQVGTAHGTVSGHAEQTLLLTAGGQWDGRPLAATVRGERLTSPQARVNVLGTYAGAQANVNLQKVAQRWRVGGMINIADLRPLSGQAGSLSVSLSGFHDDLTLATSGTVAGGAFSGPLRFQGGVLRAAGLNVTLPDELGNARLGGAIWPKLNLSGKARIDRQLVGQYQAHLTGELSKPKVVLSGQLTRSVQGLDAQGTALRAQLLGKNWKVTLSGERLSGDVRGQLGSGAPAGLLHSRLTLHTTYQSEEERLRLDGPIGWNMRQGWSGGLSLGGTTRGGAVRANVRGQGNLVADIALDQANTQAKLRATLPPTLPLRPAGTVELSALDVGAFWKRPDELALTGTLKLGGNSWAALQGQFSGQVQDRLGELSGQVTAQYTPQRTSVRMEGTKLDGTATLVGERFDAAIGLQPTSLSRLLPAEWKVKALQAGGDLYIRGSRGQIDNLRAERLNVTGEQADLGAFGVLGRAEYQPGHEILTSDLFAHWKGGTLKAQGQLPNGLSVQAKDVDATAFGLGKVNGALKLTGAVRDPQVLGQLTGTLPERDVRLNLHGPVSALQADARATLRGEVEGLVYAQVSRLNLSTGQAQVRGYGNVNMGEQGIGFDLAGQWPNLSGTVKANTSLTKETLSLRGDGQGGYTLSAGALGGGTVYLERGNGFVPKLGGQLGLRPLALVGGSGEAPLTVTLDGTLSAPQWQANFSSRAANIGGVTLQDLSGNFSGDTRGLRGSLRQGERVVLEVQGEQLNVRDLRADWAGSRLSATGDLDTKGTGQLRLNATGAATGELLLGLSAQGQSVRGELRGAGLKARVDVQRGEQWQGQVLVTEGPKDLLTAPLSLQVGGDAARPQLTGSGGLLGARVSISAQANGVDLRLSDGPQTAATGEITLKPVGKDWRWGGQATLKRPELSLHLAPTGVLNDPTVALSAQRGDWRLAGVAGPKDAKLNLTDGLASGAVNWDGKALNLAVPGLDLARLHVKDLSGTLTAQGTLATSTGSGRVDFGLSGLKTNTQIPYLGIDLRGDVTGTVHLRDSVPSVTARAALPDGLLTAELTRPQGQWFGNLSGVLKRQDGHIQLNVSSGAGGLGGTITAQDYPLLVSGQSVKLGGDVKLEGQTYRAQLSAEHAGGKVALNSGGGLADLAPNLQNALALKPTGEGYDLRARANALDLGKLKLLPGLSGQVSGDVQLRDGGGTLVLQGAKVRLGQKVVATRVEGNLVGGDWRLRGFISPTADQQGSEFVAGLTGGVLSGQAQLRAFPLGALAAAATGESLGEGVVTGLARFSLPMNDPMAGRVAVVAERIRVTANVQEGERTIAEELVGAGTLNYANRELNNVNIQLRGAGTWDVRGAYSRQRSDLSAVFTNTTFTPVLRLIPSLAALTPSLKGTLNVRVAGTYEQPRGLLSAQQLRGAIAGLSVDIPHFEATLPDSGELSGQGTIRTGGSLGSDGSLRLSGLIAQNRLHGAQLVFQGLLAPEALGALPNTTLTLSQRDQQGWDVTALSRSPATTTQPAGTLNISGSVAPDINLALSAQNYNLPLRAIYGRESSLDAKLYMVQTGEEIRVSGNADFTRLLLGRTNAPAVIPGPATQSAGNKPSQSVLNYSSPLPPEYQQFARPEEGERPTSPFLERIVLDRIPVRFPTGIRVNEALARAEFRGDLLLSGTAARPVANGQLKGERGTLFLRENEFNLKNALVDFQGDGVYPAVTLDASGVVPSPSTSQRVPMTLNLQVEFPQQVRGQRPVQIETRLSCAADNDQNCTDPNTGNLYTETQLYALLATGVPDVTAIVSNLDVVGNSALQTALNVFILGELERNVARALGLDVFRLAPNIVTDGNQLNVNPTFTVGSYLTPQLFLQYQFSLTGAGLIDASYTTEDGRFTFKVSSPLTGLDLQSLRPSFSAGYNINANISFNLGVQSTSENTKLRFGVNYKW